MKLKQHDMMLRVGISRQQYQRLESKGNPRLDTLELVAKGLKSELLLIPQEKLNAVLAILADDNPPSTGNQPSQARQEKNKVTLLPMIHGRVCWERMNEHRQQ